MIEAVIIDDELHCIDRLTYLINNYCSAEVSIKGTAASIDDGYKLINKLHPQVIFLDVQVGEHTGFDLLNKYITIPFHVIFATGHEQYAVQAFKFSAVDYLLKPIDPDELKQAVKRIKEKADNEHQRDRMELLFQNMKQLSQQTHKIAIPTITGLELVNINDIVRCRSDVNYTTIFLVDKKEFVVAKTLKEFENMLSPYNFFRIHNSHLVNLAFIKSYHKGKGGYIRLEDKTELEVSVRRKDDFLLKLSLMR